MKITYDDEANASYIYVTPIDVGGVAKTITYLALDVILDVENQIISMKLFESRECQFQNRLKFALVHSAISFIDGYLQISFAETSQPTKVVRWDANIDLDRKGQILGIEILFADADYHPKDGIERLYANDKLIYLQKYTVPFDKG